MVSLLKGEQMNSIKNFIPNRGTLASTDHTALEWLLGKWIIEEYKNSIFDTIQLLILKYKTVRTG